MWCPPPKLSHFRPGSRSAELRLDRVQRQGQRVGVLLTEGVEVEAVQQGREARLLFQRGIPLGAGGAEAAARGAGVIDGVALLRRALGVDAQAHALARSLCRRAELCQLGGGVEDDVVGVVEQLVRTRPPGRRRRRRGSPSRAAPPCPDGSRRGRWPPCPPDRARGGGRGRSWRRPSGPAISCSPSAAGRPAGSRRCGAAGPRPADSRGWAGKRVRRFGEVCQPGEGRACIEHPHQSTRAGLWLSERGRPYLSRASR